jgi:hypothetical protein
LACFPSMPLEGPVPHNTRAVVVWNSWRLG